MVSELEKQMAEALRKCAAVLYGESLYKMALVEARDSVKQALAAYEEKAQEQRHEQY